MLPSSSTAQLYKYGMAGSRILAAIHWTPGNTTPCNPWHGRVSNPGCPTLDAGEHHQLPPLIESNICRIKVRLMFRRPVHRFRVRVTLTWRTAVR
ncbi:hypothetical protein E2C01_095087 [Portunus trituberculatus]|uniref:Uncharacterized protein n=1 Tax=Portunus trituberculatus TaxID=210409 RepID=A0A5B7JXW7_PORTR|nr:hypothetical protein [Portunus trituberculatus]